jgi:hypothetical protein
MSEFPAPLAIRSPHRVHRNPIFRVVHPVTWYFGDPIPLRAQVRHTVRHTDAGLTRVTRSCTARRIWHWTQPLPCVRNAPGHRSGPLKPRDRRAMLTPFSYHSIRPTRAPKTQHSSGDCPHQLLDTRRHVRVCVSTLVSLTSNSQCRSPKTSIEPPRCAG